MFEGIQRCRICGGVDLPSILSLGDQTLTGVFPRSRDEQITRGPLELVKCETPGGCGLVQLAHSFDCQEMYGENYGYRSGLNRSMVEHLSGKIRALTELVGLRPGDLVLDIGSNDGTSLSFYPPEVTRVGMDPTAAKFRQFYQPGIEVIADFFSADSFRARFADRQARVVTSIAMFYDLAAPLAFAAQVAEVLADDGVWHLEQSYLPTMIEANAYDTVCHEHLEYYGLRQIQWIMDHCGLRLIDVALNDVNGGSFAVTVAKADSPLPTNAAAIRRVLDDGAAHWSGLPPFESFRQRVFAHRDRLRETLADLRRDGKKILGYGASTKGNVILQFCGITSETLPFIAEVNPDKFGRFTPGTGIPIISEAEAHAMRPDYLLVMPWHFRENLVAREAAFLQRGGRMLFPLPEISIVQA